MTEVIQKSAADLVCVMLDAHIWSGRRHLEKTDLVHANPEFSKLPEKELANLGSVKICDPEDIKAFQTIKGKAERVLRRAGLPILGAIGIPFDKFAAVHDELVKLQAEFDSLVSIFISAYDDRVEEWKIKHMQANSNWSYLFRDIPTATHVAGRISFDFHPYRISAPADDMSPELNARYETQMKGLKGELLAEVAAEATALMTDCLMGKDKLSGVVKRREYVTQKTLGPLKRAAEKLRNFKFLDPTIGPLADFIDGLVDSLPPAGQIEGSSLVKVWSLARMLASPVEASQIAEQAANGVTAEELFSIVKVVEQAPMAKSAEGILAVEDKASAIGTEQIGTRRFVEQSADLSALL